MADQQSPKAVQPAERPLYDVTPLVSPHATTIAVRGPLAVLAVWSQQPQSPLGQLVPQIIAVKAAVGHYRHLIGQLDLLRDAFQHLAAQVRLADVGRIGQYADRDAMSLDGHAHFHPLDALGFADFRPPFCAGAKVQSRYNSLESKSPASASSSRTTRQTCSQMPSAVHWVWHRQQVTGEGKHSGRSRQRRPLRRTKTMASKQARSSAQGRPPLGQGGWGGSSCPTRSQSRSLSCRSLATLGLTNLLV